MNRLWVLPLGMAAAFGWHLALRAHGAGLPLLSDEGEYAYAARVWSEGGLPYRDVFNQKPPMTFVVYRLSAALSSSPAAPRRAAALAVLLTGLALLLLTPKRWSPAARLAAPLAYFVLSTAPVGDFGFAANTEVFAAAFTAWAVWAASRAAPRWALVSGLLAGAALMTKQTALWPALAACVLAVWRGSGRWEPRSAGAFLAGVAAVPAFWLSYFWARGGLGFFWDCVVAGNMRYASLADWSAAVEQARFFVFDLAPAFLMSSWPAWALAALGLKGLEARWENRGELTAVLWLAGGLLAAATGLLLFPHYFLQAAPPLCLAAAYGVERLGSGKRRWAALAALALLPAAARADFYFGKSREAVAKDLLYPSPLLETEYLGAWLRERTSPSDSIWVFGSEPALYVYAGRRAATRHDFVYPLTMFPRSAEPLRAELEALRAAKPAYVVYVNQPISTLIGSRLGLEFRDAVREWLAEGYRLEGYVFVPREPAPGAFIPAAVPDWRVLNRLYVFKRR
ncbi:MAG: glycosyltransferase family 39 protein [Elusimicrobiota bacterium]|nr:glycosyltransferase family 39 protein [Elusimicrobiota bacterium]